MGKQLFLFYLMISFMFLSCSKIGGTDIDVEVAIHYIYSNGNEVFTDGQNGYIADNVRLYYNKNGSRKIVNLNSPGVIADYPYGYEYYYYGHKLVFEFYSDNNVINDTAITYIKLSPNDEDTLKCTFTHPGSSNSIVCDKVWYNGKLIERVYYGVDIIK